MDTKAVKTFVVLSETLNYQQAAQRLSYAPSTLTGHIHALEQELGVKLFTKVGRQLELTEEGRGFQESAHRLLMDYDLALRSVVHTEEELTLGIAGCELIATYAFGPFFDSFLQRCPHIQLSIHFSSNMQAPETILSGNVDVGLHCAPSRRPLPGLDGAFLYKEPTSLVVHKNHPLAGRKGLHYSDLAGYPFAAPHADCYCTSEMLKRMAGVNVKPNAIHYLGIMQLVLHKLATEGAILSCPYSAAQWFGDSGQLQALDMAEEDVWLWYGVFYKAGHAVPPALATFLREIQKFAEERSRQDPKHYLTR